MSEITESDEFCDMINLHQKIASPDHVAEWAAQAAARELAENWVASMNCGASIDHLIGDVDMTCVTLNEWAKLVEAEHRPSKSEETPVEPTACINCGSDFDLFAEHFESDNTEAWRTVRCEDCGAAWREVFRYVGHEPLEE